MTRLDATKLTNVLELTNAITSSRMKFDSASRRHGSNSTGSIVRILNFNI